MGLQCKDIPDLPVLGFLANLPPYADGRPRNWANWSADHEAGVQRAMPNGVPDKLAHAKMKQLMRRGLVHGCGCGCRGDFELTDKGRAFLAQSSNPPEAKKSPEA